MGVEIAEYISQLDDRNPTMADKLNQGDDHLRLIKKALKLTLPRFNQPLEISAEQLNKLYEYMFSVEDLDTDDAEDLKRFTVLGDAEFRKDIILTEGKDDPDAPSTPDVPKITGLADIQFSTAEDDGTEEIPKEKLSRALNLATADKRYLKSTSEEGIIGSVNKLTILVGEEHKVVAQATAEGVLTVTDKVVVSEIESPDKVTNINMVEGTATFKTLKTSGDLRVDGGIYRGSDRRLKTDIQSLKGTVDNLEPVVYLKKGLKEYGFIAQDIPEEHQHIILKDDYLSVDYIQIIPILVKEIQELKQKIKRLESNAD